MATIVRKILAMITVLSVCVSILATTASAAELPEPLSVTVTVTEADGSTTTSTTTETVTTSSDSTGGVNTETTKTESTWKSTNVKTDSNTDQKDNTTTTVDTSVITEIEGEQTDIVSVQENTNTGVVSHSGSTSGKESTDIVDKTTVTDVTKDQLLSSETTEATIPEETKWVDKETTEGNWVPGKVQQGEPTETGKEPDKTEEIPFTPPEDVTLTMSQTGTEVTEVTVTKPVSAADVAEGKITLPEAGTTKKEVQDDKGNVIGYEITTITVEETEDGYKVTTTVESPGVPDSTSETKSSPPSGFKSVSIAPPGYTPGKETWTETVGDETITTEETVTEIKDGDGNVIGYEITTVKETTAPSTQDSQKTSSNEPTTYILPEKPEASVTTDKDGYTTAITVEEILEDGEVVGYQSTLVKTDPSGKEVYREQERIYRTEQTKAMTEEKDPDKVVTTETTVQTVMGTAVQDVEKTTSQTHTWSTTVNTTEEVYRQLKDTGELYVVYQGKLFAVSAGEEHGTVQMTSIQPDDSLMPAENKVDEKTDLYHRKKKSDDQQDNPFDNFDFKWFGEYGLESAIRVRTTDYTYGYQAHQFVLKDEKGNNHYVYCADLMTTPKNGYRYNMENVFDANYYTREDAAQIQAIAVNGYWGTMNGVGSLDAVKAMLTKAQEEKKFSAEIDIDQLTDGEALAATQAAIWYYGNSDEASGEVNSADPVGVYFLGYDRNGVAKQQDVTQASRARVKALFEYLLTAPSPETDTTTPLITEKNFATNASITVGEKVTDPDGNEKYNASISFSLEIEKSKLTGNLVVKVLDKDGNELAKKSLVTPDTNVVGKFTSDITPDEDGNYTISDLQIAENTEISLTLSGTQNLGLGAYLYTAEVKNDESSQTFVGMSEGTREVDLAVKLEFSVTEPTLTTSKKTATRTDTRTDTKTDTIHQVLVSSKETTETKTDVYGTVKCVTTDEKRTHSERNWSSSYYYDLTDWEDASESGITIAEAAKTGDLSMMWVLLSVLSLGGFLLLSSKRTNEV